MAKNGKNGSLSLFFSSEMFDILNIDLYHVYFASISKNTWINLVIFWALIERVKVWKVFQTTESIWWMSRNVCMLLLFFFIVGHNLDFATLVWLMTRKDYILTSTNTIANKTLVKIEQRGKWRTGRQWQKYQFVCQM